MATRAFGAPRCWAIRCSRPAAWGSGRLVAERLGVVAGGDQRERGAVGPDAGGGQEGGCTQVTRGQDQLVEAVRLFGQVGRDARW